MQAHLQAALRRQGWALQHGSMHSRDACLHAQAVPWNCLSGLPFSHMRCTCLVIFLVRPLTTLILACLHAHVRRLAHFFVFVYSSHGCDVVKRIFTGPTGGGSSSGGAGADPKAALPLPALSCVWDSNTPPGRLQTIQLAVGFSDSGLCAPAAYQKWVQLA